MIALDIETRAAAGYQSDFALDPHRSEITQIALWKPEQSRVWAPHVLRERFTLDEPFVGHNIKFDLKHLITHGFPFTPEDLTDDTCLMAVAFSHKIPRPWLTKYEAKRKKLNDEAGKAIHREAGGYSLKTLAPYFLGVEPFWEVADHNNAEYALKDAEYTYRLWELFTTELKAEGSYEFYKTKLIPWAQMILSAELRGVELDTDLMAVMERDSIGLRDKAETDLDRLWAPAYDAYFSKEREEMRLDYQSKLQKFLDAHPSANTVTTAARYEALYLKACGKIPTKMNLASPSQVAWILKDHLKLDITEFNSDEESTGKAVLQRLAAQGREDLGCFLSYREHNKLATAFFPSYREKLWQGRLYCNFRIDGTRTGRLSSSDPNLQQVPRNVRGIFRAGAGRSFVIRDFSAIEPVVLAYLSESQALCETILAGRNFHNVNLRLIAELDCTDREAKTTYARERDLVKEVGLAMIYGAGAGRLEECANKRGFSWTLADCKRKYKNFRAFHHEIYKYKEILDLRLEEGELIRNIFGRPVSCEPQKIFITGLNTLVQGSGSDLLLESAYRANQEFKARNLDATPLLFIHDEAIVDCADEHAEQVSKILDDEMTKWELNTIWGKLPLVAEGGISKVWKK